MDKIRLKVKLFYEGHPHTKFYHDLVNSEVKRKLISEEGLLVRFSPFGPEIGKIIDADPQENGIEMTVELKDEVYLELFKNPWVASYGEGEEENGFVTKYKMLDLFVGPTRPVKKIWDVKEGNKKDE